MAGEKKDKPPVQPLKSYIEGLGIPGAIIVACALIGAVAAIWNGKGDRAYAWARNGAGVGAFLSIFALGDIIGGLLGGAERFRNGLYAALGYLTFFVFAAVLLYMLAD